MAATIKFNLEGCLQESIDLFRDRLCASLTGSPAYQNSEILVGEGHREDGDDFDIVLVVGKDNDQNVTININPDNLECVE